MPDKNYVKEINELIQKMTAEKTFSADVMEHFLGLKMIADRQAGLIKSLDERSEEQNRSETKLLGERSELTLSLKKANERIIKYKKEAKEVRKTKRELKVTLLETELEVEQGKTNYIQECLRIMFKNPVYQEGFSKSISDSKGGYQNTKTETGTKNRKVQE